MHVRRDHGVRVEGVRLGRGARRRLGDRADRRVAARAGPRDGDGADRVRGPGRAVRCGARGALGQLGRAARGGHVGFALAAGRRIGGGRAGTGGGRQGARAGVASVGGGRGRPHRAGGRPVRGDGRARARDHVGGAGGGRERSVTAARRDDARAGGGRELPRAGVDVPVRRARVGRGGRHADRRRAPGPSRRGRRLRTHPEPDARGRAGARRSRAGHRAGVVRGVRLRRDRQPGQRHARHVRDAGRIRAAAVRDRAHRDADAAEPAGREGDRRVGRDRVDAGRPERGDGRALAPGGAPHRSAALARARMARDPRRYDVTGSPVAARRSIRSAARTFPGDACSCCETARCRGFKPCVGEQRRDRAGQLLVLEAVRVQARAVVELVHPLRVVVLIPEQRQHDHRFPEVEALRHGVVAAVRDDHVDLRQDRRLRQELLAEHVVGQREQLVLRSLADDHAVVGLAEDVDQALHQLDVGRAERAERQVDDRRVAGERRLHVERRVGPHARVEAMPGGRQWRRAAVVRRLREQVHVEERRLVHVVASAREPWTAVLPEPRVEPGDLRPQHAVVLGPERRPLAGVVGRVAGEHRRDEVVLHLARVARDDARPRTAARGDRRERHHVVLDDRVRREVVEDRGQPVVHVHRTVDQRLPRRLQERCELLDRRLAELRRGLADEVLPELARDLGLFRRRRQSHRRLLEPLGLQRARERFLHDEHDPVPAFLQDVADADAVVRRPERPFGEEHDRLRVGHRLPSCSCVGGSLVNRVSRRGWAASPCPTARRRRCPR